MLPLASFYDPFLTVKKDTFERTNCLESSFSMLLCQSLNRVDFWFSNYVAAS